MSEKKGKTTTGKTEWDKAGCLKSVYKKNCSPADFKVSTKK